MQLSDNANEHLWDVLLAETLAEDCKNDLQFDNEINYEFSDNFERRIKNLIRSVGRKERIKYTFKAVGKLAVTAAAVMGIVFGGLLTVPDVSAAVKNVFREIFSTHDSYTFSENYDEITFDKDKKLNYIPRDYKLQMIFFADSSNYSTYVNSENKELHFEYGLSENAKISIDNERHKCTEFSVDGIDYFYYESLEENDYSSLVWYENGYYYVISAQLDKDEFVKIAENIK